MHGSLGVVGLLAGVVLAAPPLPRLSSPGPNVWAGPQKSFVLAQEGSPVLTAEFTHFELELLDDGGTLTTWWCSNSVGSSSRTCGAPPGTWDAGSYTWRARTLDGGERSPWTNEQAVRWDPEPPEPPASFTVDGVDGGLVQLSWPAAPVDPLSGVKEYHLGIAYASLDAGLNFDATGNITTGLSRTFHLGPGRWAFGIHTHDVAENSSPTIPADTEAEVFASPTLPAPSAPFWVQGDGGYYLQTGGGARFRWDTPIDGGVFVLAQQSIQSDGGPRPLYLRINSSAREVTVTQYSEGVFELLVAHSVSGEVSAWSTPTRFMVEGRAPTTPVLRAEVDGGSVSLAWNEVAEFGSVRSGLEGYRLSRCCSADASVLLATYDAGLPDGSLVFEEQPGPASWRYEVRAFDRAGNLTVPGVALVTVRAPPVLGPPRVPPLSNGPVAVSWEAGDSDVLYELRRVAEGEVEGVLVMPAAAAVSFEDPAPDGRWQYRVRGRLPPQDGPWSEKSAVVEVDTLPPRATVSARRRSPSEVEVAWSASDPGSGLAQVTLERETAGAVASLGAVSSSPFMDAPPDGVHAWRVVAVDRAGNRTESAWSEPLTTPGPFVQFAGPAAVEAQCGAALSAQLAAHGDGEARWTLREGPAGLSLSGDGVLGWVPSKEDTGVHRVQVRAEGAGSAADAEVEVTVSCERRVLSLGFGCSASGGGWVLAALAWCCRRRARWARLA